MIQSPVLVSFTGAVFILLLGACAQTTQTTIVLISTATQTALPATETASPTPSPYATASAMLQPSSTSTKPAIAICSPLAKISIQNLRDTVTNPFLPPIPGSDDPHQGIDFAYMDATTRIALSGSPVGAALPGRVAGTINDRFPYGYAVIIETSLDRLAPQVRAEMPTPEPTRSSHPSLTCPQVESAIRFDSDERSLYLLYGHLQAPTDVLPGQEVSCGDRLGATGDSGNALNPHLHLEARIGPAGAIFTGLAHYETRASPSEMRAYCDWRVSGTFQVIDPLKILGLAP